jgi:metallophosphoesterase superfamily enzyme
VPAHSLAETQAKLESLFFRVTLDRLIVAGDFVESPRPCRRTEDDVRRLARWLAGRGVRLTALAGNHDPLGGLSSRTTEEVASWTIGHGHRPVAGDRTITGHIHPVLRVGGVSAPCFLLGPRTIVLPAFSSNAAGWNVVGGSTPRECRDRSLVCVAGLEGEWFDFGSLAALSGKVQAR